MPIYFVNSVEADTAAAKVLQEGDRISIEDGDNISVTRGVFSPTPWTVVAHTPEDLVLNGLTNNPAYSFVICEGTSKIVGIIKRKDSNYGGGSDPGAWEADEAGSGG